MSETFNSAVAQCRKRCQPPWLLLTVLCALALQGCERGADSGATSLGVAPGRPGTGNAVVEVEPSRAGSINESPGTGGSRGMIPEGATGHTTAPGAAQRPGVGLDGGLGAGPADASAAQSAASSPR